MPTEPDRCPICHAPNRCAVASGADPHSRCWCMDESFPAAAHPNSAAIEARTRGVACLCQACVQRLKSG